MGASITATHKGNIISGEFDTGTGRPHPHLFALGRAEGVAGLYRHTGIYDGTAYAVGWIVRLNGNIVGAGAKTGAKTVAVASTTTANDPDNADPVGTLSNPSGEAVPLSFTQSIRCGILGFRIGFNAQQALSNLQNGDIDGMIEAQDDAIRFNERAKELGCIVAKRAREGTRHRISRAAPWCCVPRIPRQFGGGPAPVFRLDTEAYNWRRTYEIDI